MVRLETALLNLEIERLEREQQDTAEAQRLDGFYLGAVAFRNLHDQGILRHVHRQEARLRRMVDQLTEDHITFFSHTVPSQPDETNSRRPATAPQKQKRPTYDEKGRRIHYAHEQRAA